jgi:HNH endonuclease
MRDLEKQRAAKRRWKVKHPEWQKSWDAQHPELVAQMARRQATHWNAAHPEQRKAQQRKDSRKRKARKRNAAGSFTEHEFLALKVFYGNKCLCCLRSEDLLRALELRIVPDHVVALAKGGTNDIGNIQPLCHGKGGCNNRKGVKHEDYRGYVNAIDRQPLSVI